MIAPKKGGTSPSSVAIATSHGSSMRRRASLNTHHATPIQKMTRKKRPRFRTTIQVPESKKSRSPLKRLSFCPAASTSTETSRSEEQLPDKVPSGKREPDDRQNDDCREREDAQSLYERLHGTRSTGRNGDRPKGIASPSRGLLRRPLPARGPVRARLG